MDVDPALRHTVGVGKNAVVRARRHNKVVKKKHWYIVAAIVDVGG